MAKEVKNEEVKNEKKFTITPMVGMLLTVMLIVGILLGVWLGFTLKPADAGTQTNQDDKTNATTVSEADVKDKVTKYLNDNLLEVQGVTGSISELEKIGNSLYKLTVDIKENGKTTQQAQVYATANAEEIIIGSLNILKTSEPLPKQDEPIDQVDTQPQELPKTDKPAADLYIFSYCPAGSAALDSFAKAAEVLADSADIKVKFFSNMHGAHELQQNKIQECIQVVDKTNYWKYAQKFASDIYPYCGSKKSVDCDKNESIKLMDSLGINSTNVFDCVEKQGELLYQADTEDAIALQLQYSPSVVVNGVYFGNADRSPEGLKTLICSAFNTAPTVCNTTLGADAASANGGCGAS
ncbi:MAG: hypothetical protein AABW72_04160 [archaeon]